MALQFTGQAVFVALGKAKRATFFSIFRKVIIVVPLTILLPKVNGFGVDGVFWAEPDQMNGIILLLSFAYITYGYGSLFCRGFRLLLFREA